MATSVLTNTEARAKQEDNEENHTNREQSVDEETSKAAQLEQDSEIACLELISGDWKLTTGSGYRAQWNRAIVKTDELTREDDVFIISVLGNTTAGKSFISKHFFHPNEKKPTTVDSANLRGSTTGNINCFESNKMTEVMKRTLVLDFEGEKGTSNPLMLYARKLKEKMTFWTPREMSKRLEAVSDYFPKLAYILSNVVILIGREEIVSTDYIMRCCDFARRANLGVDQVVYRPVLILIQNQSALDKEFDAEKVRNEFFEIHRQAENLEFFRGCFSQIYCIRLPHVLQSQKVRGVTIDGEIIFKNQIGVLKRLFSNIYLEHQKRLITHPQWLFLIDRVLGIVSSGRSVSIHSLLSEIVNTGDQIESLTKKLFVTLYSTKNVHTPEWFRHCRLFAVQALARYLAMSFLEQGNIMSERLIREKSKEKLESLWKVLDDFAPCEAVKPLDSGTTNEKPIYCYQHRGAHPTHRPSEGSGSWLPLFVSRVFSFIWDGEFQSTEKDKPEATVVEEFVKSTFTFLRTLKETELAVLHTFKKLIETHTLSPYSIDGSFEMDCVCCLHPKDCECFFDPRDCQNLKSSKEGDCCFHPTDPKMKHLLSMQQPRRSAYRIWLKRQLFPLHRRKVSPFAYCDRCRQVFKLMYEAENLELVLTIGPSVVLKETNSVIPEVTINTERLSENTSSVAALIVSETTTTQLNSTYENDKIELNSVGDREVSSKILTSTDHISAQQTSSSAESTAVLTIDILQSVNKSCKICHSVGDDYCLVPCGHRGFCQKCALVFGFCPTCGKKKDLMVKLQDA